MSLADAREKLEALARAGIDAYGGEEPIGETIARAFESDGIVDALAEQVAALAARCCD